MISGFPMNHRECQFFAIKEKKKKTRKKKGGRGIPRWKLTWWLALGKNVSAYFNADFLLQHSLQHAEEHICPEMF